MSSPNPFQSMIGISNSIKNILTPASFANPNSNEMTFGQSLFFFIILCLVIYVTMWIGSFVFNRSVIKIFPSVKKVSALDFFGLYIVLHLLLC